MSHVGIYPPIAVQIHIIDILVSDESNNSLVLAEITISLSSPSVRIITFHVLCSPKLSSASCMAASISVPCRVILLLSIDLRKVINNEVSSVNGRTL
jgi:hypothetical protein